MYAGKFHLRLSSSQFSVSGPQFGAWVMIQVDIFQTIQCYVGVNLRGGNVCVTKNSLHRTQISAVFHHVSGTTVAQHVRAGLASGGG
jgi:hypothetical protein